MPLGRAVAGLNGGLRLGREAGRKATRSGAGASREAEGPAKAARCGDLRGLRGSMLWGPIGVGMVPGSQRGAREAANTYRFAHKRPQSRAELDKLRARKRNGCG